MKHKDIQAISSIIDSYLSLCKQKTILVYLVLIKMIYILYELIKFQKEMSVFIT